MKKFVSKAVASTTSSVTRNSPFNMFETSMILFASTPHEKLQAVIILPSIHIFGGFFNFELSLTGELSGIMIVE
ncbi:hypothetical protein D3C85_822570 [compost metagenome]